MSDFADYKKEIMDAAHDERVRLALSRAIKSYRANTEAALKKFPHTVKLAEEVRGIKDRAIGEMESLARQASEAITENRGKAYIARTAAEALDIIGPYLDAWRVDIKGFSDALYRNKQIWVGVTIEGSGKTDLRHLSLFAAAAATRRFVSAEPLFHCFELGRMTAPQWLILGADSRKHDTYLPGEDAFRAMIEQADDLGIPVFIKDNALKHYPGLPVRREFPEGLRLDLSPAGNLASCGWEREALP